MTTWSNAVDGSWTSDAKWSDGEPDASSDAALTVDGFYRVVLDTAASANSLLLDATGARFIEYSWGSLSLAGSLTVSDGVARLSGANSFGGGASITGGLVYVRNADALGDNTLSLSGGTLYSTPASLTLAADALSFAGETTIGARHASTLAMGGESTSVDAQSVLHFGSSYADGTVVFSAGATTVNAPLSLEVDGGWLVAGDSTVSDLTAAATSTGIAAHTAFDLNGFDTTIFNLTGVGSGGGTVTNSSASLVALHLGGGDFSEGTVAGNIALDITGSVTLSDIETTSGITIEGAGALTIAGERIGVANAIVDEGELILSGSGHVDGDVSGAGSVTKTGDGTFTLTGHNSYAGGTVIEGGALAFAGTDALGSGSVTLSDGDLVSAASLLLTSEILVTGTGGFEAAHRTGLTIDSQDFALSDGSTLVFGSADNDGLIRFNQSDVLEMGAGVDVVVAGGKLRQNEDHSLSDIFSAASGVTIESGAKVNTNGFDLDVANLSGDGLLTNRDHHLTTLTLHDGTSFDGTINGNINLDVVGSVALTGTASFDGTAEIEGLQSNLTIDGVFGADVSFNHGGTLNLGANADFTGTIENFDGDATIDFENIGPTASMAYNTESHILTITDGGLVQALHFGGDFVLGNFSLNDNGSGGSDLIWQFPSS
ncbi:MAG TPA: autotransporter-associated beta strand repeat-containing protein [Rhizomicrobium sp.]|jgi:autotransporter-associated beta strand protein|nr:autotransporter-associated beta strand repeat-containing protein [Rhizomicrobium sp.]